MALIKFTDWLESSAMTRQRDAWMRYGSYPLRADFMSRSTPHPAAFEKLEKALGKNKDSDDSKLDKIFKDGDDIKPKKKKKKKHRISEAKKPASIVHSDIESWLKSVENLAKDLKDLEAVKAKFKEKMEKIKDKYKSDKSKDKKTEKTPEKEPEEIKKPEEIQGKAEIGNDKSDDK